MLGKEALEKQVAFFFHSWVTNRVISLFSVVGLCEYFQKKQRPLHTTQSLFEGPQEAWVMSRSDLSPPPERDNGPSWMRLPHPRGT